MNKKVLWGLLILLSSALLFSGELQDTITPDTTAVDTVSIPNVNPSTKTNKSHFSIGYTGSICRTSLQLRKLFAGPMDILAVSYYIGYLNFSYQIDFSKNHKILLGLGFGWLPILNNRVGLSLWLLDGTMIEATEWSISPYQYSLKYWFSKKYFVGIDADYVIAKTKEVNLTDGNSSVITARKCIGGGVSFGWEGENFLNNQKFIPYMFVKVGWANEYWNSSPWDWGDGILEKLEVGLGGIYFGLKYRIGK